MMRLNVLLGILLAALLAAALLYSQHRGGPVIVSGFLEADEIRLGSRVGGRVRSVHVQEGSLVQPGAVLIELEPFDLQERLAQAEAEVNQQSARYEQLQAGYRAEEQEQAAARLKQMQADLERLRNGPRPQEIEAAQAEVALAEAELTLAEENLARIRKLRQEQSATQEQLDRAMMELKASQARLVARQKQLNLLQEGTRAEELAAAQARVEEAAAARNLLASGYRREEIAQAYAALRAAESARDAIQRQLAELKIIAPTAAVVDAIELQPGDLVAPNAPVISLIDTAHLWVRAYVPENRLGLSLGQSLPITIDSFPGEVFHGEVSFVSRQAEFTPNNVQTPEERSKQVFRIKLTVHDDRGRLRPGMAADVWLEGHP
jgi:multidrug resistance efflux pump